MESKSFRSHVPYHKFSNPEGLIVIDCLNTLTKTEIIYPKNVGALVAMNFT